MAENTLDKLIRARIFGKSPIGAFLRVNQWMWNLIRRSWREVAPFRWYGRFINALVRRYADRTQYFGTFFLRNRPQLDLICRLSREVEHDSTLNVAVLGCSNGAEVYSILATLRRTRPELNVVLHAVDISADVLAIAQKGSYSISSPELVGEVIFQRITPQEIAAMFDRQADRVTVQPWLREGIVWQHGDVRDPEVLHRVGRQDIVVANNFLCHMRPPQAEECLLGIAPLVKPGGYLVISGIDLDVRANVALAQHWKPVATLLEDVHNGDSALRNDWPFSYWGLEPFDRHRAHREHRYAAIFQIGQPDEQRAPAAPAGATDRAELSGAKAH